jgi:hypothetical protein
MVRQRKGLRTFDSSPSTAPLVIDGWWARLIVTRRVSEDGARLTHSPGVYTAPSSLTRRVTTVSLN